MRNELKILIAVFTLLAANVYVANAVSGNGFDVNSYKSIDAKNRDKYQQIEFDQQQVLKDLNGFMDDNNYDSDLIEGRIRLDPMPDKGSYVGGEMEKELINNQFQGLVIFYKPFKGSLLRTFPKDAGIGKASLGDIKAIIASKAVKNAEQEAKKSGDYTKPVKLILKKIVARANGDTYTAHIFKGMSLEVTPQQGQVVEKRAFSAKVETEMKPKRVEALISREKGGFGPADSVILCKGAKGLFRGECGKNQQKYNSETPVKLPVGDYKVKFKAVWPLKIPTGLLGRAKRFVWPWARPNREVAKTTDSYQGSFTITNSPPLSLGEFNSTEVEEAPKRGPVNRIIEVFSKWENPFKTYGYSDLKDIELIAGEKEQRTVQAYFVDIDRGVKYDSATKANYQLSKAISEQGSVQCHPVTSDKLIRTEVVDDLRHLANQNTGNYLKPRGCKIPVDFSGLKKGVDEVKIKVTPYDGKDEGLPAIMVEDMLVDEFKLLKPEEKVEIIQGRSTTVKVATKPKVSSLSIKIDGKEFKADSKETEWANGESRQVWTIEVVGSDLSVTESDSHDIKAIAEVNLDGTIYEDEEVFEEKVDVTTEEKVEEQIYKDNVKIEPRLIKASELPQEIKFSVQPASHQYVGEIEATVIDPDGNTKTMKMKSRDNGKVWTGTYQVDSGAKNVGSYEIRVRPFRTESGGEEQYLGSFLVYKEPIARSKQLPITYRENGKIYESSSGSAGNRQDIVVIPEGFGREQEVREEASREIKMFLGRVIEHRTCGQAEMTGDTVTIGTKYMDSFNFHYLDLLEGGFCSGGPQDGGYWCDWKLINQITKPVVDADAIIVLRKRGTETTHQASYDDDDILVLSRKRRDAGEILSHKLGHVLFGLADTGCIADEGCTGIREGPGSNTNLWDTEGACVTDCKSRVEEICDADCRDRCVEIGNTGNWRLKTTGQYFDLMLTNNWQAIRAENFLNKWAKTIKRGTYNLFVAEINEMPRAGSPKITYGPAARDRVDEILGGGN